MRRRDFITLLGGATAWPFAVRAQQPMIPVVGYFFPATEETTLALAFRKGLSEHGFVEGKNVAIEYRYARGDISRTPELVADLIRRRVSVLATTGGAPGALAAKAQTATIPIVFEIGDDPVANGLVASFNRPGGNITGVAALNSEMDAKRLGILAELVPKATRIGVIVRDVNTPAGQARVRDLPATTAAALGRQIEVLVAQDGRAIEAVFASLAEKRIDALYFTPNTVYIGLRVQIATAAARYAIPTIYGDQVMVEAGGLISYGTDAEDDWRIVGTYVGRILKGEKVGDLPVQRPSKFQLAVNLPTSRFLALTVPPTLLLGATRVIE
jgi:putative tryptophan/tyrosine transport system substrate-binding protein